MPANTLRSGSGSRTPFFFSPFLFLLVLFWLPFCSNECPVCQESESCSVSIEIAEGCKVLCSGYSSCSNLHINRSVSFDCIGALSCRGLITSHPENVNCSGPCSCSESRSVSVSPTLPPISDPSSFAAALMPFDHNITFCDALAISPPLQMIVEYFSQNELPFGNLVATQLGGFQIYFNGTLEAVKEIVHLYGIVASKLTGLKIVLDCSIISDNVFDVSWNFTDMSSEEMKAYWTEQDPLGRSLGFFIYEMPPFDIHFNIEWQAVLWVFRNTSSLFPLDQVGEYMNLTLAPYDYTATYDKNLTIIIRPISICSGPRPFWPVRCRQGKWVSKGRILISYPDIVKSSVDVVHDGPVILKDSLLVASSLKLNGTFTATSSSTLEIASAAPIELTGCPLFEGGRLKVKASLLKDRRSLRIMNGSCSLLVGEVTVYVGNELSDCWVLDKAFSEGSLFLLDKCTNPSSFDPKAAVIALLVVLLVLFALLIFIIYRLRLLRTFVLPFKDKAFVLSKRRLDTP